MDLLRMGIHLRGYAQKNPKQEYKRESFELFQGMLENIKSDVIRILCHVRVRQQDEVEEMERRRREAIEQQLALAQAQHPQNAVPEEGVVDGAEAAPANPVKPEPFVRDTRKVGRNDPCPCGSGKKFKQCHGKME
jgi:preprotein translocase subunit SecA